LIGNSSLPQQPNLPSLYFSSLIPRHLLFLRCPNTQVAWSKEGLISGGCDSFILVWPRKGQFIDKVASKRLDLMDISVTDRPWATRNLVPKALDVSESGKMLVGLSSAQVSWHAYSPSSALGTNAIRFLASLCSLAASLCELFSTWIARFPAWTAIFAHSF